MGRRLDQARFDWRSSRAALRILAVELGWGRTLVTALRLALAQAAGRPFKQLGPPADEREDRTRRQAAGAILLVQQLERSMERPAALALAGRVVEAGSLIFLSGQIPRLERPRLLAMEPQQRQCLLQGIVERFPNSTVEQVRIDGDAAFEFQVVRCTFVELCAAVGRPELAGLFCAGDLLYFEREQPAVVLERPGTLALGQSSCHFKFRWSDQR